MIYTGYYFGAFITIYIGILNSCCYSTSTTK